MTGADGEDSGKPNAVQGAEPAVDAVFEMPGHLLRRCHQIAVAVFLEECQSFDLTPPQFAALAALDRHGPLDQASLGGVAALDRTTVAVVLKNLSKRGLVVSAISETDRRARITRLTPEGAATLAQAMAHAESAQARILAPLRAAERRRFVALLAKVAQGNNDLSRAPRRVGRHKGNGRRRSNARA